MPTSCADYCAVARAWTLLACKRWVWLADDPAILAWAATNDRIVVTHDRATMPDFAYARVVAGEAMAGVFVVHDRMATRQAIEELLLLDACSKQAEWVGLVVYLPR